ncbi:hypothetical protein [uncultured Ottowia sp.]|uniref:hypothetical protein n=1 Tax=uncultured Ottowia sp. TaxID=543067 RepID=UPI002592628C|nr:hypothetical protein [uncultured Ottowia sp.]
MAKERFQKQRARLYKLWARLKRRKPQVTNCDVSMASKRSQMSKKSEKRERSLNLHALSRAGWRSEATEKAALPCQKATLAGLCRNRALYALDSCGVFTRRCLPGDALPVRRIA